MALFNMFRSQVDPTVSPKQALAVSLIYCIASDGEIANEEIAQLHAVLGPGARTSIEEALKYARAIGPKQFLDANAGRLNRQQALCIMMNMLDSVMADGHAAPEEQELVRLYQEAFKLDDATLEPYFTALVVKNDKSVLGS